MTAYYKAVRYDYGSFYDPQFKYGPVGTVVSHPAYRRGEDPSGYLSVSVEPADCTGFQWRVNGEDSHLLIVEPIGEAYKPSGFLPNKRAVESLRVVGELPISEAFGPNGVAVVRYLESVGTVSAAQLEVAAWAAAWEAARASARASAGDAAWAAAGAAAREAARASAWDAAWVAAGDIAGSAAIAVVVRDKITAEQFDVLTAPMRAAGVVFDGPEEKGRRSREHGGHGPVHAD